MEASATDVKSEVGRADGLKSPGTSATNPVYVPRHRTHAIQTCLDGGQSTLCGSFDTAMSEMVPFLQSPPFSYLQHLHTLS